ncbi:MAG: polysaccharide biosynthesis/export family protein [Bacteroidota bacterium]|nr:polysaccharide biosynthesis/export family protein [Bacteroidota bacterium]
MKCFYYSIICLIFFSSCSTKDQLIYLKDIKKQDANSWVDIPLIKDRIESGDILKIDVKTIIPEASLPYNVINQVGYASDLELIKLDGYLVDDNMMINFPVLGKVSTNDLNEKQLEEKLKTLLEQGNHLSNPTVKVRRINSKFTVLGEVRNPGTFSYSDKKINILQALGYAGDLTIDGKRKDITLIRDENGTRKAYNIELTKSEFLNSPLFNIKNNDILIINPSFNKVKSAGFIGSPASIATIASLLLNITLLINF